MSVLSTRRDRCSHVAESWPSVSNEGRPRHIDQTTIEFRREAASGYLKQAGIAVRVPGRWGRAANPANEVSSNRKSEPDRSLQCLQ